MSTLWRVNITTTSSIYLLISRFTRRLARSEELLSRVFEASSNGIAVIRDLDRRYLLVNTAFSAMCGYADSELVGQ
ncbi:MAG: PAS domain-containing protein, partial [Desulfuromonadaceae bacterium]|nr:PAS domain-containing protein [Desulfuromonadaceae bacterium]